MKRYRTDKEKPCEILLMDVGEDKEFSIFGGGYRYHDTWRQAHRFLIDKAQEQMGELWKRGDYLKNVLDKLWAMKEPE